MDTNKNYVGKVVKVQFTSCGQPSSRTGVVFQQDDTPTSVRLRMIMTTGVEWEPTFREGEVFTISSVRIDKDLRAALENACDAKIKQKEFLDRFWKEKSRLEREVENAVQSVRECSGEMSRQAFMKEVEALFCERYPETGGFHNKKYFSWNSVSDKDFSVSQIQEIEKYIQPESYPFVYREYDGTLRIDSSCKAYKEFCEKNAPQVILEPKDKAKTTVSASIGDKNFLLVSRSYTFPLKDGFTKKGLQGIRDLLHSSRKPSLADRIQDANAKSKSKDTGARTPGKYNLSK